MYVFYVKGLSMGENVLTNEESHHAIKVLRLKAGSEIIVTDGKGLKTKALITVPDSRSCFFEPVDEPLICPPRPFELHIAIAPTKNIDRIEWFLEKATECGIDTITPLICDNSERLVLKPDRLEKILLSAMKQSLRVHLPVLNQPFKSKDFIKLPFHGQKFIPHCYDKGRASFKETYTKGNNALVLIGPEGDFSIPELELAISNGFIPVSMGDFRLRTETAALAACMQLNFLNDLL